MKIGNIYCKKNSNGNTIKRIEIMDDDISFSDDIRVRDLKMFNFQFIKKSVIENHYELESELKKVKV